MVTLNWPIGTRVMGSCGLALSGLAVRVVDPQDRDVEPGQEGELIVRGPNVMIGYHRKPAETSAALRDGWYRTGDLARYDLNGYLTITGRLKEIIIRGGQNISPVEVEEVVASHPAVADCAVVGIPHEFLGEVPVAFVVARQGQTPDAAELREHARSSLSAYKVPHAIHVVGEIPRTGSGKAMRFKLKQLL
jgi:acyl-CoA synthetase (AMP-forming)/AMP-acid ligase II